ncbi:hypothetical protein AsAng_0026350 [Aureispira anguillae]|uniref:Uncharacterized protein n=2 Tax=Aureispira anguillae TaxID=2864201 RepID=A0A916DU24_9BACT|nr:hypothetical protein AsAng_0026350 [Aureispira anguillae]
MTIMKVFSFLFAFLLVSSASFAQESDKTLVKTLNPLECPNVQIDIQNKGMDSEPWDEGTIRVQLEIKANIPNAVLAQLVKAGRYSIDGGKDGETYIVSAPNLSKAISIGGKDLEEEIKIHVQTPGYFALNDAGMLSKEINEETIAARSNNAEEAAAMIKKMKAIKEDLNMEVKVVSTSKYKGEVDLSKYKLVIDGKEITADQIEF